MISGALFQLDLAKYAVDYLYTLLDIVEKTQADQFYLEIDRHRFIARRGQLRLYISQFSDQHPATVEIAPGINCKPMLPAKPNLHFSLSKSHGVALCVLSSEGRVGCDIERIDPALASQAVAKRFFALAEIQAVQALEDEAWVKAFYRCWTCKEAYVKGVGWGLSYPLKSFAVTVSPDVLPGFTCGGDGWALQSFIPLAGYQAALASEFGHTPMAENLSFFQWVHSKIG